MINFENYLTGFVWIIAVLFSSTIRPELPDNLVKYFNLWYIKLIIYVLIAYVATSDIMTALLVSICFYVLMSMLNEKEIAENFLNSLNKNDL